MDNSLSCTLVLSTSPSPVHLYCLQLRVLHSPTLVLYTTPSTTLTHTCIVDNSQSRTHPLVLPTHPSYPHAFCQQLPVFCLCYPIPPLVKSQHAYLKMHIYLASAHFHFFTWTQINNISFVNSKPYTSKQHVNATISFFLS